MSTFENTMLAHEPNIVEQTQVFEEAAGHHGSISAAMERYGGDISQCPYLQSMGSAGIALVQQMQAAERDPNRGPTIAEVLAAKKAQREAEAAAPVQVLSTQKSSLEKTTDIFIANSEPSQAHNDELDHIVRSTLDVRDTEEEAHLKGSVDLIVEEDLPPVVLNPKPEILELVIKHETENTLTSKPTQPESVLPPKDIPRKEKPVISVTKVVSPTKAKARATDMKIRRPETQIPLDSTDNIVVTVNNADLFIPPYVKKPIVQPDMPSQRQVDTTIITIEHRTDTEPTIAEQDTSQNVGMLVSTEEIQVADITANVSERALAEHVQPASEPGAEEIPSAGEPDVVLAEFEPPSLDDNSKIILSFLELEQTALDAHEQSDDIRDAKDPNQGTSSLKRGTLLAEHIAMINTERKIIAVELIGQIEELIKSSEKSLDDMDREKTQEEIVTLCQELIDILLPDIPENEVRGLISKIMEAESIFEESELENLPREKGTMERKANFSSTLSSYLVMFLNSRPLIAFLGKNILKTIVLVEPAKA